MSPTLKPFAGDATCIAQWVDALELSCEPARRRRFGDELVDRLERELAELREQARQAPAREVESRWVFEAAGRREVVMVTDRGFFLRNKFMLRTSRWTIGVAADSAPGPRFFVQMRSSYLAEAGPVTAFQTVSSWCGMHLLPLVGRQAEDVPPVWRVSRVDLAADVAGLTFERADVERFTTRARNKSDFVQTARAMESGRRFTGVHFGQRGAAMFARIYLKTREAAADAPVRARWRARGYRPEVHGEDVWRIEFEVRAAALAQFRSGDEYLSREPEDVLSTALDGLWRYATSEWLVLRAGDERRSRLSRAPVDPWWESLSKLDGFNAREGDGLVLERGKRQGRDCERLFKLVVGLMVSLAALHGQATWHEAVTALDRRVRRVIGEETFAARVRERSELPVPAHVEPPRLAFVILLARLLSALMTPLTLVTTWKGRR